MSGPGHSPFDGPNPGPHDGFLLFDSPEMEGHGGGFPPHPPSEVPLPQQPLEQLLDLPVDPLSMDLWDEEIAQWNNTFDVPKAHEHYRNAPRMEAHHHTPSPHDLSYSSCATPPAFNSSHHHWQNNRELDFGDRPGPMMTRRAASLPMCFAPHPTPETQQETQEQEPYFHTQIPLRNNLHRPVPRRNSARLHPSQFSYKAATPSPLRGQMTVPWGGQPSTFYQEFQDHTLSLPTAEPSPAYHQLKPVKISLSEKSEMFAPKLSAFTRQEGTFPFMCDICNQESFLTAKRRGNMVTSCGHYVACNECRGRTVRRLLRCATCCKELAGKFPLCERDECVSQLSTPEEPLNTGSCPCCEQRLTKELCSAACDRRKSKEYNQIRLILLDRVGILVREVSVCCQPTDKQGVRPCSHFSYCQLHDEISKGHGKKVTCKVCKGGTPQSTRKRPPVDDSRPTKRSCTSSPVTTPLRSLEQYPLASE